MPTSFDRLTAEEYLALDASSDRKWEFYYGSIRAMPGASFRDSTIFTDVSLVLGSRFGDGSCTVHMNDLRVAVSEAAYYYPDIAVLCKPPDLTDTRPEVLRNPAAVIEVLTLSTEKYDRGEKLAAYQGIAPLQACVLLRQDEARAEVLRRTGENRWPGEAVSGLDATPTLEALGVDLPLAQVYRNVEFGQRGDGA